MCKKTEKQYYVQVGNRQVEVNQEVYLEIYKDYLYEKNQERKRRRYNVLSLDAMNEENNNVYDFVPDLRSNTEEDAIHKVTMQKIKEILKEIDEDNIIIFDEYLEGNGIWRIAKSLNEQKIPTKTGKAAWLGGAIYIILKNSVYTGDLLLQKTYSEDIVPFVRRKNNGEYRQVLIENDHEPIVTHEEYEAVQRMLKQMAKVKKAGEEEQREEPSEFKGKVICGICGSSYNRQERKERTGKINITWSCARRIQTKELCENDIIKESQLEQAFIIMWNKLSSNCDEILVPLMNELEQLKATTVSNEKKKYSIKETTKVEREKIVQDAYAIAVSTGKPPTEETMQLVKEYVDGKKEISEILEETIRKYQNK